MGTPNPLLAELAEDKKAVNPLLAELATTETPDVDPTALDYATNTAGGVWQSMFDVIDTPTSLINLGIEGGKGLGWLDEDTSQVAPISGLPGLKQAKEALTKRTIEKGTNTTGDMLRTGAEWGSGGLVNATRKGVSAIPDVLAGMGAAGGEQIGGTWGEIIGGFTGLLGGHRANKAPRPLDKAETQATNLLADVLDTEPNAQRNLQENIDQVDVGSLADLTGSSQMYNVENTLAEKGSDLAQALRDKDVNLQESIIGQGTGQLPQDKVDAAELAAEQRIKSRISAVESGASSRIKGAELDASTAQDIAKAKEEALTLELSGSEQIVASAEDTAKAAQGQYAGTPTMSEVSKSLRGEVLDNYNKLDAVESEEWAKFDKSPPIELSGVSDAMAAHLRTMPADQMEDYTKLFKPILTKVRGWDEGLTDPKSIQYVLHQIRDTVNKAKETGSTSIHEIELSKFGQGLEKILYEAPSTQNYRQAMDATKAKYDKAIPENVKKPFRRGAGEKFAAATGRGGSEGVGGQAARLTQQSEHLGTVEASHDVYRTLARKEGVDDAFLERHEDYLNDFPELREEFEQVAATKAQAEGIAEVEGVKQKGLTKAIKAAETEQANIGTQLTKSVEQAKTAGTRAEKKVLASVVADYSKDPAPAVKKLITPGKIATDRLKKLNDWATKQGVADSFKSQVRKQVENIIYGKEGEGTKVRKVVSPKSIVKFNEVRDTLVNSGVMTQKEADTISRNLAKTAWQTKRKQAGKVDISPKLSDREKAGSALAAIGIVATTGIPHALIATRVVKDMLLGELKNRKLTPAGRKKIEDFIVNPEKYAQAYQKLQAFNNAKVPSDAMSKIVNSVVGTGQALSTEE